MIKIIKKVPIYPKRFVVVVTDDFDKDGKEFGITFTKEDNDSEALAFRGYYKKYRCIYIFIRSSNIDNWGIWAHECLHCVNYIMEDVGIPADNNNDEAHAYLITWMMNEIQSFLIKEERKIK